MAYLGLLIGLVLLIWLALRGVNIIFASLLCGLIVAVSNQLDVATSMMDHYASGKLGAFTFAGKFFLLFAAGAVFGRVMGESQAAASIAMALVRWLGAHRALWITVLASTALTYGGVVVFVVIFAMYPLGLRLLQEADIPKRLFCGAAALGAGTFTLTALPGTPSIHNVIPTVALGTDLFAAPVLGLFGAAVMFILGMSYLEFERRRAQRNGERFEASPTDTISTTPVEQLPSWGLSLAPLFLVIGTILAPRLATSLEIVPASGVMADLVLFAGQQPIFWPSLALFIGSFVAYLIIPGLKGRGLVVFGNGVQDSIMPLINTAAVIGFGGIVVQTAGFQNFATMLTESSLPPILSAFTAISTVSAITGSASGGLQIFMATMADSYVALGIEPAELHRIVAMASGGLDSLPHCGSVVALLTITGLTHKQAYKDIGIITVVVPVIATLLTIGLSMVI